jgi:dihydroxy-acid dehydratase
MLSMGWSCQALAPPTVGICDTGSGLNNGNRHSPDIVRTVEARRAGRRRAVLAVPLDQRVQALAQPPSMQYRNLAAIDTEQMMRAQPLDAVVLLIGATRPCRRRAWPWCERTFRR